MADNSAQRVIQCAMDNAGLLQEGQTPNSTQNDKYLIRLNDVLNVAQTQGLKLWLMQDIPVTLTASKGLYTFMPGGDVSMTKPTQIVDAYYADPTGIQRPLANPTGMSWNEWVRLSQPASTGQVNSYFVDKQYDRLNLHLWLVPDAVCALGTVHVIARTQQTNVVTVSDNMLFPPEWFIYLQWALAAEICVGQPESIVSRCDAKMEYYRNILEGWDTEDASLQFQPDQRGTYAQGDFR